MFTLFLVSVIILSMENEIDDFFGDQLPNNGELPEQNSKQPNDEQQPAMREISQGTGAVAGFAYSVYAIASIIITLAFLGIIKAVPEYGYAYWCLNFIVSPIAILITIAFVLKVKCIKLNEALPLKCHYKYYIIGMLLMLGLFFSLSKVNDWFLNLLNLEVSETYIKLNEFLNNLSGGGLVLMLFFIAVFPAIAEECLYRGVMLNTAENTLGTYTSVFAIGFAFAISHGALEQSIYQFILGCVFALVAVRAKSVLPGIVMHFFNNGLVIIISGLKLVNENGYFINQTVEIILTVLGYVVCIVCLLLLILDKGMVEKSSFTKKLSPLFNHAPTKKYVKGSAKEFFIAGSVAFLIFAFSIVTNVLDAIFHFSSL